MSVSLAQGSFLFAILDKAGVSIPGVFQHGNYGYHMEYNGLQLDIDEEATLAGMEEVDSWKKEDKKGQPRTAEFIESNSKRMAAAAVIAEWADKNIGNEKVQDTLSYWNKLNGNDSVSPLKKAEGVIQRLGVTNATIDSKISDRAARTIERTVETRFVPRFATEEDRNDRSSAPRGQVGGERRQLEERAERREPAFNAQELAEIVAREVAKAIPAQPRIEVQAPALPSSEMSVDMVFKMLDAGYTAEQVKGIRDMLRADRAPKEAVQQQEAAAK